MTRPAALDQLRVAVPRSASTLIAAESSTLTDANFPVAQALDCAGFDTIWLGVEITAGTAPTMTLEVLVRDDDAADGARWKKLLVGSADGVTAAAAASQKTSALDGASFVEVRVYGRKVMLRIDAVTNAASTTAWKILAMPGKTRNGALR